jgi:hypothetical protein
LGGVKGVERGWSGGPLWLSFGVQGSPGVVKHASLAWNIMNNVFNCENFKFPIEIELKNPRTDSIFESLMNFKRDSDLLENLINSPKFLLDLIFTKVKLVGYTCM